MRNKRLILLALLVALLAFLAAGCGGDDDDEAGGDTSGSTEGGGDVSGTITVLAVWTGAEGRSLPGRARRVQGGEPRRHRHSTSPAQHPATVLSTVGRGRQPAGRRRAALPGHHGRLRRPRRAEADRLRAGRDRRELRPGLARARHGRRQALTASSSRAPTSRPSGTTSPRSRTPASMPPRTGTTFLANAETLAAAGTPAYSIGGVGRLDAHRPVREHLPPHGGAGEVRPAGHARHPVDRPVGQGRAHEMAKVLGDTDNIAGGTSGALQTDFPTSVTQVYSDPPKAAQVIEGDFVDGVIAARRQAEAGDRVTTSSRFPDHRRLRQAGRRRRRRDRHVQGQPGGAGADRVPRRRRRRPRSGPPRAGSRRRTRTWTLASTRTRSRGRRRPRSQTRRSSASTSPTCSRPRSAATRCSASCRTSCATRTTSTGRRRSSRRRRRRRTSRARSRALLSSTAVRPELPRAEGAPDAADGLAVAPSAAAGSPSSRPRSSSSRSGSSTRRSRRWCGASTTTAATTSSGSTTTSGCSATSASRRRSRTTSSGCWSSRSASPRSGSSSPC